MNDRQQQFYDFMMERVEPKYEKQAQELLADGFARQGNGTFTPVYLNDYIPKMLGYIKPEFVEETKSIMTNFRA